MGHGHFRFSCTHYSQYQKPPYYGTLKEVEREEDLRLAGEDRSPKKRVEAGMNYGSWRLIERSGKNS
jgi:hypothetical protein